MNNKIKIAIIGASGYTGIELIRLLLNHPQAQIVALISASSAGQDAQSVFPHLATFSLPPLQKLEEVDFAAIDLAFCCLPHTTSGEVIKNLLSAANSSHLKIIDLSADFRLSDPKNYQKWYGHQHNAPELQQEAVYGLCEFNRQKIKKARLIANPGCYPTAALLPLLPLFDAELIELYNIIIDAKSGVSGAGRALKTNNLYCEINDSFKAYSVGGTHRHIGEIEQELSLAASQEIIVNFTPHLVPMNRGIISTIYVSIKKSFALDDLKNCLATRYGDEYFVNIADEAPSSREVFGTNFCKIAILPSRFENGAIIISAIDNLVKGASGSAVQNMNIIYGFDERMGLELAPIFP